MLGQAGPHPQWGGTCHRYSRVLGSNPSPGNYIFFPLDLHNSFCRRLGHSVPLNSGLSWICRDELHVHIPLENEPRASSWLLSTTRLRLCLAQYCKRNTQKTSPLEEDFPRRLIVILALGTRLNLWEITNQGQSIKELSARGHRPSMWFARWCYSMALYGILLPYERL